MALTTVVVNGNIHLPDGAVPDSATLEFRLVGNGFDMTSNEVIPQSFIADDLNVSTGAFTANLWPNDRGSLATYYQCILTFTGSSRGKKFSIQLGDFQVPEAGAPHEFATLRTAGVVSANSVIVSQLTQEQYNAVADTVVNAEAVAAAVDVAEAARDAAVVAGAASGVYSDTTLAAAITAGLAGTSNGDNFYATGADVDYISLYLNDAGSAVEYTGARFPTQNALDSKASLSDPITGADCAIVDDSGNAALVFRDDAFEFQKLNVVTINGVDASEIVAATTLISGARSNIEVTISYGQSNSIGTATDVITTVDRFDNLRFEGGVRSQDSATPYTSLVPLTEASDGSNGETPISGSAEMLFERLADEDGISHTDVAFQVFGCAPGEGGQLITQLWEGTDPYTRLVTDVQNAVSLGNADGKSVKCRSVLWSQGEADQLAGTPTPRDVYISRVVGMRDILEASIQSETGQSEPVALITSQFNAFRKGDPDGEPTIPDALRRACRDNDNMYMAGPWYPFQANDYLHPDAEEVKRIGAMYGLVQKRVLIDGVLWRPLEPIEVEQFGNWINIYFHVPVGNLVFDTTLYAAVADMGFSVVDSVGSAVSINAVQITGPNSVSIACASDPSGGKVRYAWVDGGNLRDEQGDTIIFDGGTSYTDVPMHNWCVIFEEEL